MSVRSTELGAFDNGRPAPLISVLLPTTQAWPVIAESLQSLLSQIDAPPFEILLLDGHGAAVDEGFAHPAVRWLRHPGLDSFALRAEGVSAARGAIIAISEDHCVAPSDWLASIAAAHAEGRYAAIVGVTANHPASSIAAMDRANFVVTFAGQNPQRLDLDVRRLPVPTNVSFRRDAFPATASLAPGDLEYRSLAEWRHASRLGVSHSVVLQHKQCWGAAAPGVHFASGRSFGASVREAPWRSRIRWWASLPLLPLRLASLTFPDLLRGVGGRRASVADALCLCILIAANVCGQIAGALFGEGRSRQRL
jgi:hypothetical protein